MKLRKFLVCMLFCFTCLFLLSCVKSKNQESFVLQEKKKYTAELQMGEYKTEGKLYISDGEVHFTHLEAISPLFGLEEVIGKDRYRSRFLNSEWETTEIRPLSCILYDVIFCIQNGSPMSIETYESAHGDVIKSTYPNEPLGISLITEMSEEKIMIKAYKDGTDLLLILTFPEE